LCGNVLKDPVLVVELIEDARELSARVGELNLPPALRGLFPDALPHTPQSARSLRQDIDRARHLLFEIGGDGHPFGSEDVKLALDAEDLDIDANELIEEAEASGILLRSSPSKWIWLLN